MILETSGRVEYGARAFGQDADLAIRGDVTRALIELITNSDDAYASAQGGIKISVQATSDPEFPVRIVVQDSATGLDAEGLKECFAVLGGQKADNATARQARGLLGRGAKDVASLGRVEFHAIKNGAYSCLRLSAEGDWNLTDVNSAPSDADLQLLDLGPGENGLTNVLWVRRDVAVPSRIKLQQQLSTHAQLRDLVDRRAVVLSDDRVEPFLVQLSALERRGDVELDLDLNVHGYDVPAHLTLRKLPRKAAGSVGPYSEHGLLVRSGVTTFENTWFGLEGSPEANFFAGEVDAPEIAEVIRAFDVRDELGGPFRLLARDRDGLVPTHPYRQALARAVVEVVKPVFDEMAKSMDARKRQGESLSRAFKVASDALKDQLNRALDEIEDDNPRGGGTSAADDFVLIPPRRVAKPGESLVFTLRSKSEPKTPAVATIESDSDAVLGGCVVSHEGWKPHSRLEAVQTQVYASAGNEEGSGVIRITAGERTTQATVIVRNTDDDDEVAPDGLELSPAAAKMAPTRGRKLRLRAPMSLDGVDVALAYTGIDLASVPPLVTLAPEIDGRWVEAQVGLRASNLRGEGYLEATVEGWESAHAKIVVDETAGRGGLGLEITLSGHKSPVRRVELINEQGLIRITVYAFHPTFGGLFGKYDDAAAKFAQEDSPTSRAVLAEVIAGELAAHLTERDYAKRPDQLNDAPRVLRRRAEFQSRFLTVAHKALQPQPS
jgi:hypothetical protein